MSIRGFPSTRSKSALRPGAIRPLSVHPNSFAVTLVVAFNASIGDSPAFVTNKYNSMCKLAPNTNAGAPAAASEPLCRNVSNYSKDGKHSTLPNYLNASGPQLTNAVNCIFPFRCWCFHMQAMMHEFYVCLRHSTFDPFILRKALHNLFRLAGQRSCSN